MSEKWRNEHPEEMRLYRRNWYNRNKEHSKQMLIKRRNDLKEWLLEIKSKLKCEQCECDHIACLQFHHLNPNEKEINISMAIHNGWRKDRILKEMEKCKVLCSNCHFILHWDEKTNRSMV